MAMRARLGDCEVCGFSIMDEKCTGLHCGCGQMIEVEVDGPAYAFDGPTVSPLPCEQCGEQWEP